MARILGGLFAAVLAALVYVAHDAGQAPVPLVPTEPAPPPREVAPPPPTAPMHIPRPTVTPRPAQRPTPAAVAPTPAPTAPAPALAAPAPPPPAAPEAPAEPQLIYADARPADPNESRFDNKIRRALAKLDEGDFRQAVRMGQQLMTINRANVPEPAEIAVQGLCAQGRLDEAETLLLTQPKDRQARLRQLCSERGGAPAEPK